MRKGDPLAVGDHVSRYCGPSHVSEGKVLATAFRVRPGEDHLSTNWLEYFRKPSRSRRGQIAHVREAFRAKAYKVKHNGRFVVLDTGKAAVAVRTQAEKRVEFLYWPQDDDRSHCGIFGYSEQDLAVAAALRSVVSASDVFGVPDAD